MALSCRDDPVVCIDFFFLFLGEYLKDWTTLALLALLLALLLKLRAERKEEARLAYGERLQAADEKRQRREPAVSIKRLDCS